MSKEITFYTNPMSRGRIVHWLLEELGVEYDAKLLDFSKNEQKGAAYLAINPMGKVPAIVHRGTVITETPAICTYLADSFPKAGLAPAVTNPARGTYLRWLFFTSSCVEYAVIDKMYGRLTPTHSGSIGYGTHETLQATLEKAVTSTPFLLGERFSAADLYLAAALGWGMAMKGLDPFPAFQTYVARCTDRPSYQRVMEQTKTWEAKLKGN